MNRLKSFLLFLLPVWLFVGIFYLPYAIWSFPLSINWFMQNDYVLFRDIVYHHTPMPLFILNALSHIFGNTYEMLQITSYLLALILGYGIYFTGKTITRKVGISTLFLFVITLFTIGSNFNIEEMLAALFSLYAAFFFLKYRHSKASGFIIACGMFVALGVMSKQTAIGIIPAIGIILLWDTLTLKKNKIKALLKTTVYGLVGVGIVTVPIIIYFATRGALADFWYWNVTYNLFVYPAAYAKQAPTPNIIGGLANGMWIILAFVSGVLLMIHKHVSLDVKKQTLLFLIALITLLPALLPSFHVYKLITIYPYALILLSIYFSHVSGI